MITHAFFQGINTTYSNMGRKCCPQATNFFTLDRYPLSASIGTLVLLTVRIVLDTGS